MTHIVVLGANGEPAGLSEIKGKKFIADRVEIRGMGSLSSCLITFSKAGDFVTKEKDLLFMKRFQEKTGILLPRVGNFLVSDYDFCHILFFAGNILRGDEIILYLSSEDEL